MDDGATVVADEGDILRMISSPELLQLCCNWMSFRGDEYSGPATEASLKSDHCFLCIVDFY